MDAVFERKQRLAEPKIVIIDFIIIYNNQRENKKKNIQTQLY